MTVKRFKSPVFLSNTIVLLYELPKSWVSDTHVKNFGSVRIPAIPTVAAPMVQMTLFTFTYRLTLLVGWQKEHPACKKLSGEVLTWLSVRSEVQMICIWSG